MTSTEPLGLQKSPSITVPMVVHEVRVEWVLAGLAPAERFIYRLTTLPSRKLCGLLFIHPACSVACW